VLKTCAAIPLGLGALTEPMSVSSVPRGESSLVCEMVYFYSVGYNPGFLYGISRISALITGVITCYMPLAKWDQCEFQDPKMEVR
jgi:hypothetical protein